MLKKIYTLKYEIEVLTGLHIGGSDDAFDIGGADANVIKDPMTKEPYIPGSTIKGKLKSLLLYKYGKISDGIIDFPLDKNSYKSVFEPVDEKQFKLTRGIFRDAYLSKESKDVLEKKLGKNTYTEIKGENTISILKGEANPRFIERVPAGVSFEGEINLLVFNEDNEEELKNAIIEGFKYIELNYIGGNGTRGYGKVRIKHGDFVEELNENI